MSFGTCLTFFDDQPYGRCTRRNDFIQLNLIFLVEAFIQLVECVSNIADSHLFGMSTV